MQDLELVTKNLVTMTMKHTCLNEGNSWMHDKFGDYLEGGRIENGFKKQILPEQVQHA